MNNHSASGTLIVRSKKPSSEKQRLQRRLELVLAEIEYLNNYIFLKKKAKASLGEAIENYLQIIEKNRIE